MKYYIHFGRLHPLRGEERAEPLCYVKWPFYTQNKLVCSMDGTEGISVEIEETKTSAQLPHHKYVIKDKAGRIIAEGQPGYAEGTDLHPISHAPRADHVTVFLPKATCCLVMQNSQNFILTRPDGQKAMELIHNGVSGGWNVSADDTFAPLLVMGIFLFCRYLDKENEFVIV